MLIPSKSSLHAVLVVLLLLTAACRRVPGGVVNDDKMAQAIADLELADAVMGNGGGGMMADSVKRQVRRQVLAELDVTPEEFDSSLAFYGRDIERYSKICDRAIEITQKRADEASKSGMLAADASRQMSTVTSDADSVNMWTAGKTYRISPSTGNFIIPFVLPTDHNAEPGDTYLLRFKAMGQGEPVYASIAADYNGLAGTDVRQTRSRAAASNWVVLSLSLNPDKSLKEIYGAIGVDITNCAVMIDSISLTRVRLKDSAPKIPGISR